MARAATGAHEVAAPPRMPQGEAVAPDEPAVPELVVGVEAANAEAAKREAGVEAAAKAAQPELVVPEPAVPELVVGAELVVGDAMEVPWSPSHGGAMEVQGCGEGCALSCHECEWEACTIVADHGNTCDVRITSDGDLCQGAQRRHLRPVRPVAHVEASTHAEAAKREAQAKAATKAASAKAAAAEAAAAEAAAAEASAPGEAAEAAEGAAPPRMPGVDETGMDAARTGMDNVGFHYVTRSQWPDGWEATVAEAASAFDAAILGDKQKLLERINTNRLQLKFPRSVAALPSPIRACVEELEGRMRALCGDDADGLVLQDCYALL